MIELRYNDLNKNEIHQDGKILKLISFHDWCKNNNRQDILDRWDYKLNNVAPNQIKFSTHKKYWFLCPRNIHNSELKSINHFTNGRYKSLDCDFCNSFAQYGMDNIAQDFLEKYWDYEKNIMNPFEISYKSHKTIWIKCQEKDYHNSYEIRCDRFVYGNRCPYCHSFKIHPLDSLVALYPEVLGLWSNKNEKSPYEYMPMSNQKVWWKCQNNIHKDYNRDIYHSNRFNFRCPMCYFSKGEERIQRYLINNHINYESQKTFYGLVGLGGGLLSYDFYLPDYRLLIEYQGEYHDGTVSNQTEKQFEYRKNHDIRKKQYAKDNNIELLEIWYWEYDNIENILSYI